MYVLETCESQTGACHIEQEMDRQGVAGRHEGGHCCCRNKNAVLVQGQSVAGYAIGGVCYLYLILETSKSNMNTCPNLMSS